MLRRRTSSMCLLCLTGDKSINHFNSFLMPPAATGGSAPSSAAALSSSAPRQGQGSQSLSRSAPTPVQAFTTAAIVGLAKADRTPAQQRDLITTATTLSALAAASATTRGM